jgi:hypothetical protein
MMRTRWIVAAFGLSLVLNVFLGAALWRAARRGAPPAAVQAPVPACSETEQRLREQLQAQLCGDPPDCAAIEATFARLDAVRAQERQAALDRWVSLGRSVQCRDDRTSPEVERLLCPWKQSGG